MRVIKSIVFAGVLCGWARATDPNAERVSDACRQAVKTAIDELRTTMSREQQKLLYFMNRAEFTSDQKLEELLLAADEPVTNVDNIALSGCDESDMKNAHARIRAQMARERKKRADGIIYYVKATRIEWLLNAIAMNEDPVEIMTNMQFARGIFEDPRFNLNAYAKVVQKAGRTRDGRALIRELDSAMIDDFETTYRNRIRDEISNASTEEELNDAVLNGKRRLEAIAREWNRGLYGVGAGTLKLSSLLGSEFKQDVARKRKTLEDSKH